MTQMKQAAPAFETAEVWNSDGTPKILVRVQGLQQIGPDEFELSGVKMREIDWKAVQSILMVDEAVLDDISDLVWRSDLIKILSERMTRS